MSAAPRSARVLVVAGHDPSYRAGDGGAGVDADREAIEALGAEASCVVTARTRQESGAVHAIGARDPGAWLIEARAELARPDAAPLGALKSGLLPGADHVRALARLLDQWPPELPVVVDPVIAASGGEPFLDDEGVAALLAELVPRGVLLTPNLPELARLAAADGERLERDPAARLAAARRLLELGPRPRHADSARAGVVVKAGHGREDPALDLVLVAGVEPEWLAHPRHVGRGLHGSGCRFASALAAGLALGATPVEAARVAGRFVAARIAAASRGS